MKIWKKFVLFTIAIISIVLICSRYYIVKNNFVHSIENASYQNNSKHILEKYTLENDIIKIIQERRRINRRENKRICKKLTQLYRK